MLMGAGASACGSKKDGAGAGGPGAGGAPGKPGGGGPGAGGGRRAMEFPVEVQPVTTRRVEYAVRAVGSVEAFEQVQVTARVAGAIEKVDFIEGDRVKAEQVLVAVEPRRYQIAVEAAQASLARAKAEGAESKAALQRRTDANEKSPGLVKAEEIESLRAKLAGQEAAQAAAEADLHLAELNLRDAYVRAPIAGQIEERLVRSGQYVQAGTPVATLQRRDPLLLRFQVPEGDAKRVTRDMPVRFKLHEGDPERRAVITYVAQAADAATRMVAVTARVDDPAAAELRPGAFAQVVVPVDAREDAPVISETAVRPSERGFVVFVVEESVAKERRIGLGLRTLDGQVEVTQGLSPGDALVVRGAEALSDGAKVKVAGAPKKEAAADGEAKAPAPKTGGT